MEFFQIGFVCQDGSRNCCRGCCSPWFSVDQFLTFTKFFVQCFLDLVHQFYRHEAHEVKAETIEVVFLCPIKHGIQDVLCAHAALTGGVVAAAGAVGRASVFVETVVVARHGSIQEGVQAIGVIVYHVHDDTEAVLMEGHNQLF